MPQIPPGVIPGSRKFTFIFENPHDAQPPPVQQVLPFLTVAYRCMGCLSIPGLPVRRAVQTLCIIPKVFGNKISAFPPGANRRRLFNAF